jgi:hypothetical protein
MRTLMLAAAVLCVAAPAFACEGTSQQSVSTPSPTTTVQTDAPMTPIPAQPKG